MAKGKKLPQTVFYDTVQENPGVRAALKKQFGVNEPDVKVPRGTDPSDPAYFQNLVKYFFHQRDRDQRAGGWSEGWRFCDQEYTKGRLICQTSEAVGDLEPARAYALVSTVESQVLGARPRFFVKGFSTDQEESLGPVIEQAVNNEWQQDSRMKKESRYTARDCSRVGIGVMLSSYEENPQPDSEKQTKEAEKRKRDLATDPVANAARVIEETSKAEFKVAAETPVLETTYEQDNRVVKGRVVSRRISPWDFLFDPTATSEEDLKWCGRIIAVDLDAVKENSDFKNTKDLKATARPDKLERESNRRNSNDDKFDEQSPYNIVYLYEIFWRKPDGGWRMVTIAEGYDKFLRDIDNPYWIGNPYRVLRWNEDGEEFVPQSDVQIVTPEIQAERLLLTKVFDGYMREHVDLTMVDETMGLTEENLVGIGTNETGKFVTVNKPADNRRLADYFHKMPKDAKSPEAMNLLAMIERLFQVSSGLSPNQFGQALKSGTTATEAAEVGSSSRGRASHKFEAMEEFLAGVAQDRIGLMAQYYDTTDMLRIVDKKKAEAWAKYNWSKGDVCNGLGIIVEPGSTRKTTEEARVRNMIDLLGIITQDPVEGAKFNKTEMYNDLIRFMGIHDGTKYQFNQDGEEVGNQEAELRSLQGGLAAPGGGGSAPAPAAQGLPAQLAGGVQ